MSAVGHVLWQLLGWPYGIILGNLLASVVWSALFEWRLRSHHARIHKHIEGLKHGRHEP